MSRTKKTWLPIVIVGVLAALIVILALVGSAFNDDKDNTSLKESAKPAESAEPEETLPPEVQELLEQLQKEKEKQDGGGSSSTKSTGSSTKSTGSSTKSTGSTTKNTGNTTKNTGSYNTGTGTDTQQTEDNGIMGQVKEYGGKLAEGMKDAAGNVMGVAGNAYKSAGELVGTIRDIGSAYNRGNVQGILTAPVDFAGGVKDFLQGVAGTADEADAGK